MSVEYKATLVCDACGKHRTVDLAHPLQPLRPPVNLLSSTRWWFRYLGWMLSDDESQVFCDDCSDGCPGRKNDKITALR